MQPRLAFYSYPINIVALCYLASQIRPRAVFAVPVALFILANIDLTGFASQSMMFDYGRLAWYWY